MNIYLMTWEIMLMILMAKIMIPCRPSGPALKGGIYLLLFLAV